MVIYCAGEGGFKWKAPGGHTPNAELLCSPQHPSTDNCSSSDYHSSSTHQIPTSSCKICILISRSKIHCILITLIHYYRFSWHLLFLINHLISNFTLMFCKSMRHSTHLVLLACHKVSKCNFVITCTDCEIF